VAVKEFLFSAQGYLKRYVDGIADTMRSGDFRSLFAYSIIVSAHELRSTDFVNDVFIYAVEESSQIRVACASTIGNSSGPKACGWSPAGRFIREVRSLYTVNIDRRPFGEGQIIGKQGI
jgi:hypothetical protein